jgi:FdhE protein
VRPLASVLREDKQADTVRRSLLCSLCGAEWGFPRVLCPACREERPDKLPRYTAQEIPWMRVEACDTCGKYLKSVDLTQNWEAEPLVDELASTPLDVIAREHGYTKIAPNLAGI